MQAMSSASDDDAQSADLALESRKRAMRSSVAQDDIAMASAKITQGTIRAGMLAACVVVYKSTGGPFTAKDLRRNAVAAKYIMDVHNKYAPV